jgi:hypothetical protein
VVVVGTAERENSEPQDVTSRALGRKGTVITVRIFGTNSLKEGAN